MKRLSVLILTMLLVVSFCSCKQNENIPVINTSDLSDSSDITQSESTSSEYASSNISSATSTSQEESSAPSSDTESITSQVSSKVNTPASSNVNTSSVPSNVSRPTSSNVNTSSVPSNVGTPTSSNVNTSSVPSNVSSPTSSNVNTSSGSSNVSKPVSSSDSTSNTDKPDDITNKDFRICYAQLTDKQKGIYVTLEKAVKNMETGWINLEIPAFPNYRRDINLIVTALQTDMPQYFWIPPAYYTGNSQDGETIRILFEGQDDLTYLIDKSDRQQMEKALFNRIEEIMSQVTATTPFEIELQLHDILCSSVTYATSTENPLVYTAYGALVNGQAVCEGYSRAMQLLLAQYNIKSTLVTGESKGVGHMWNLVNIENAWYHLDATWNDLPNGKVSHTYFNLTDKDMGRDHGRHKVHTQLSYEEIVSEVPTPYNFELPPCKNTENNYFVKKDYIYGPNGEEKIAKLLTEPFDIMEFKFSDDSFKWQFEADRDKYLGLINEALSKEKSKFRITNYSVTETTLIIYNKTTDIS